MNDSTNVSVNVGGFSGGDFGFHRSYGITTGSPRNLGSHLNGEWGLGGSDLPGVKRELSVVSSIDD